MDNTTRRRNSLKILHWNANGIRQHREELQEFLVERRIDVALISETHLRPGDGMSSPTHRIYRTDRQGPRGGGTAVYIHRRLDHYPLPTPQTTDLEVTMVCVKTTRGSLNLAAGYIPPDKEAIPDELDAVFDSGRPTILAGDLNAKHPAWHSRVRNQKGRLIQRYVEERRIAVLAPSDPTHFHGRGADVLDIALLLNVSMPATTYTIQELGSDHLPVVLHLGDAEVGEAPIRKAVDWKMFSDILSQQTFSNDEILTVQDLDKAVDGLTTHLQGAQERSSRAKILPAADKTLPQDLRELIREKNRAKKRYARTLDPLHKRELNQLQARVKDSLKAEYNERFAEKLSILQAKDVSLWRMTKALRQTRAPLPPLQGATGVAIAPEEKAEAFASCLEGQCTLEEDDNRAYHDEVRQFVEERLNGGQAGGASMDQTDEEEVRSIIKAFKTRKAPGPDDITNKALKLLPEGAIKRLVQIVNAAIRLTHFPMRWKQATVIMIPKPGKQLSLPQNYRPISLLPTMGKVLERVILTRIKHETENLKILPDFQFGFRGRHACTQQVMRVVEYGKKAFSWKKYMGAVFLDIEKAFDRVWHDGLLQKMIQLQYQASTVNIIRSFLCYRSFSARVGTSSSSTRQLRAGVPQGSCLSPLLFNIYASDMPTHFNTEMAQFADDTMIMTLAHRPSTIITRLQFQLNQLDEWFKRNRIRVNANKSAATVFIGNKKLVPRLAAQLSIDGNPIPWERTVKYLGVVLDDRMSFGPHIREAVNKARGALNSLYPMLGRRSRMSSFNKLLVYKAILRPMATYAAPVWANAANIHLQRLQTFQNRVLRISLDAPWYIRGRQLHDDCDLPTIREFMREETKKFVETCSEHENPLVREALNYDVDPHSRIKRVKDAIALLEEEDPRLRR